MAYENNPYRDEDGEPLMDFDEDIQSDSDEPQQDDGLWGYDDRRQRSPTPVYSDSKAKPRKRLIKKYSPAKDLGPADFGLSEEEGDYGGDDDIQEVAGMVRDDDLDGGNRKEKGVKRKIVEKKRKGEKGDKKFKVTRNGGGRMRDKELDPEMKEMWATIAGGDSEGEEGEGDDEINELFKIGKKKNKNERSPAETALLVEKIMAELEVVAEEDALIDRKNLL